MPSIQVPFDPDENFPGGLAGDFSDMLFDVAVPQPEEEPLTPEEERWQHFEEHIPAGGSYAGRNWEPVAISRSEVCVYGGWPRVHIQIGAHCPHGMLEQEEDDNADE